MRKKRAWSTRADDAESQESAAFEASVAAAQDTAAKSGAFLSTAKSDLTDHKRWLQAQTAAVERDRARHERWLQRQREHRLALARRERTKKRRQMMRQRAFRAMRQALFAAGLFVRTMVVLALVKTGAGIKFVAVSIGRGFAYVGARIGDGLTFIGRQLAAGAGWTAEKLGVLSRHAGAGASAGLAWSGAKARASAQVGGAALAAGSSAVASKAGSLSRSAGQKLSSGFSAASAQGSVLAGATGRSASKGLSRASETASALLAASRRGLAASYSKGKAQAGALAPALYVRMAKYGRQAERYARASAARLERPKTGAIRLPPPVEAAVLAPASEAPTAVIEVYGPHLDGVQRYGRPANDPFVPVVAAPAKAEIYGPFYEGFWVEGVSPNEPRVAPPEAQPVPPRVAGESALSLRAKALSAHASERAKALWAEAAFWSGVLWGRAREAERSQMMIIAGAVLLICGGLLLGGGLLLRAGAGTGSATAAQETVADEVHGIAWTFEEADRPLPERAVFTLTGTPESFRINGLSLSGTNLSDTPLTGVQAVLKPDVQRPELKLTLQVDKPAVQPGGAGEGDEAAQALVLAPEKTVPAHAPFRLVFAFPPEAMDGEDGITVEEFFESYGGLMLKLRFESNGEERSIIQYLPPEMLKGQLDEVSAHAGGS